MAAINRKYYIYLEDMLTLMLRIEEYIGGMEFKEFKMNYMVVDAVVRNFEMIWEISKINLHQNSIDLRKIIRNEHRR